MKKTNSILDNIVSEKKKVVRASKKKISENQLFKSIEDQHILSLDFFSAIKSVSKTYKIIGEVKQSSPSSGLIRKNFSVKEISDIYQTNPTIVAISVITEQIFFNGRNSAITDIKNYYPSGKPILRKDFIFDPYQIVETKSLGADAFLLIARLFDKSELIDLVNFGFEVGLEPLVEIHSKSELEIALQTNVRCIGVNSRNLSNFSLDLSLHELLREVEDNYCRIAESGVSSNNSLKYLSTFTDAVLIGSYFMCNPDINKAINLLTIDNNSDNLVKK